MKPIRLRISEGDRVMEKQGVWNWSRVLLLMLALFFWVGGAAQALIIGEVGPTFNFSATADHISTGEGNTVLIWGYAIEGDRAQYPGPTLIVNQGDVVTVNLTNQLAVPTSIVFPGHRATATGGSAGLLTSEAAPAGGSVSYTFTATHPGTYMYHSGTNPDLQSDMGLFGAMIVRPDNFNPAEPTAYGHPSTAYDYEVLFLLSDMDPLQHDLIEFNRMDEVDTNAFKAVYWFINGRNGPDTLLDNNVSWLPTQPYNSLPRIRPGDNILIRFVGAGRDSHPLHTHGNHYNLIAKDGRMLSSGPGNGADLAVADFTQTVNSAETYDGLFTWTGEKMGWDMYGTEAMNPHTCDAVLPDVFDSTTHEYCPDHDKPIPVQLPGIQELTFSPFYSGSPYLGGGGFLPPGEGGFNQNGGYYYMWHSHNEKELTNFDVFPGGMLTFLIIEPPTVTDIQ
jgi:FtsP/CotA-like multicopper oxidase with cupredoxin domain